MDNHTTTIRNHLSEPLTVGEPDVAGSLAVFPLFGGGIDEEFQSFACARGRGARIGELDTHASVNDLVVENSTAEAVLLYEGEEVLGAQQNRTFDVTVLVAAQSKLRVPVSCVEAGRWDGSRHGEDFTMSPQAAYPELRRQKHRQVRERVAAGMEARADQGKVWIDIDRKSARMGASSATGAMHDIYEGRRDRLRHLAGAIARRDGQLGTLVAIGGRFAVLDYVGRGDVLADLFDPLVQGYALDALEASDAEAPSVAEANGFVSLVLGSQAARTRSIGVGEDVRFAADGVAGAGLLTKRGVVQLTAFPEAGDESAASSGISRPSRRRHQSRR
jgi:hypothetical protein